MSRLSEEFDIPLGPLYGIEGESIALAVSIMASLDVVSSQSGPDLVASLSPSWIRRQSGDGVFQSCQAKRKISVSVGIAKEKDSILTTFISIHPAGSVFWSAGAPDRARVLRGSGQLERSSLQIESGDKRIR